MIDRQKIISLIDLTQLGDNDTKSDIIKLCTKAKNSLGEVAAVCVYKKFIPVVRKQLGQGFKIATVVNFPAGGQSIKEVILEAREALTLGADELDLVIDYKEYIKEGSSEKSVQMISDIKKLCKNKILKVIIESGELKSDELIEKVSQDVIDAGADFIKTSTGKTKDGATLQAAKSILKIIKKNNKNIGFKASGGIRTYEDAIAYIKTAQDILSDDFIQPITFRFGVSGLLDNLLNNEIGNKNAY